MRVLHLAALAEQRVRFIEEQDRALVFRCFEHACQVLFGFADVLAGNGAEVDTVQVELQVGGQHSGGDQPVAVACADEQCACRAIRSEEHTSELQSLMRISYAVFCLKKKKQTNTTH